MKRRGFTNIVCPIDGKDDSIQKISALVSDSSRDESGTYRGPIATVSRSGGKWGVAGSYTTLNASSKSISELAQSLLPPAAPRKAGGLGGCVVLVVLGSIGLIFGALFLSQDSDVNYVPFALIAVIIAIVLVSVLASNRSKKNQKEYDESYSAWSRIIARWNKLYYCHKHDIVFNPDDGKNCNRFDFHSFLSQ